MKDGPVAQESQLEVVSVFTEAISESGNHAVFLTVENTSCRAIAGAYGKIKRSKSVHDDDGRYNPVEPVMPKETNLAWRSGVFAESIPAKFTRDLMVAEKLREYPGFTVFLKTSVGDSKINLLGSLVLDIEIGSEIPDSLPLTVQIKLSLGVFGLEAEILSGMSERQLRLNLTRLLHDGKDIVAQLKRAQNRGPSTGVQSQVSAEISFEAWCSRVHSTLKNTALKKLWYEQKPVDYRKDSLSDYISESERALERAETILKNLPSQEA